MISGAGDKSVSGHGKCARMDAEEPRGPHFEVLVRSLRYSWEAGGPLGDEAWWDEVRLAAHVLGRADGAAVPPFFASWPAPSTPL